jgi:23S rRNA (uracil1939-C5)-methyltransferase
MALRPALLDLVRLAATRSREVGITLTDSPPGADVVLDDARELDLALRQEAAAWAASRGVARFTWNNELVAQAEPPWQPWAAPASCLPRRLPPGHARGRGGAVSLVREATRGATRIADLFAGRGHFRPPLAETAEVHAVEGRSRHARGAAEGLARRSRASTASRPRRATSSAVRSTPPTSGASKPL